MNRFIILAAGKGTRLYPLTYDRPKSLLEIKPGLTILESQIQSISKACKAEIFLMAGPFIKKLRDYVKGLTRIYPDVPIYVIRNPFYEFSNNLVTVWLARHYFTDNFIIVNGDNIFHHSVVKNLLEQHKEREICAVIDRKAHYSEEDMKVVESNGHILKISKKIPVSEANGESIGMIRFLGKGANIFSKTLDSIMDDDNSLNVFWLYGIQHIIDSGFPVHCVEIDEKYWSEIDFHKDMDVVREHIKRYIPPLNNDF